MVHKLLQGILFVLHRPVGRLVEYGVLISVVGSGAGVMFFYVKRYVRAKHLHLPFHPIGAKARIIPLTSFRTFAIRDLLLTKYDVVHEDTQLGQMVELVKDSSNIDFPVVDDGGRFLGLVLFNDFRTVLLQSHLYSKVSARDVMKTDVEVLKLTDSLEDAMMKFGKQNSDILPVVDASDSKVNPPRSEAAPSLKGSPHIRGIVKRSDLMKRYRNQKGTYVLTADEHLWMNTYKRR